MNRSEIKSVIQTLARSQGLYGRLLRQITPEGYAYLEEQNFKDALDLVLWLEG